MVMPENVLIWHTSGPRATDRMVIGTNLKVNSVMSLLGPYMRPLTATLSRSSLTCFLKKKNNKYMDPSCSSREFSFITVQ